MRPSASASYPSITASVLASADRDRQVWRQPNSSYGEAVGITQSESRRAASPRQPRSADARNLLSGQVEWPYGGCDDRSGSEKSEAVAPSDALSAIRVGARHPSATRLTCRTSVK